MSAMDMHKSTKLVILELWISFLLWNACAFQSRTVSNRWTSAKTQAARRRVSWLAESLPTTRVVVIGGGWAGFSAADSLSYGNNLAVDLLDASPRGPGGLASGWTSPLLNRTVEAGIHGFWREYRNTIRTLERIVTDVDEVLTPYTPSVLYSKSGRVALAPVLVPVEAVHESPLSISDSLLGLVRSFNAMKPGAFAVKDIIQVLPPPLDVALLAEFVTLTSAQRLSAIKLLPVWADFDPQDAESWKRYDDKTAESLFRSAGVSPELYRDLVSPLLHVLPMCPGYDCSAAAALSCFHVFALQSAGAFDVRWCRGTISDKIFNPWVEQLQSRAVTIHGGAKVTRIVDGPKSDSFVVSVNDEYNIECDAVVFATGITAIQRLQLNCPVLSNNPYSASWKELRAITCVCCRLFFKGPLPKEIREAMKDSPVAVCGPNILPPLVETGFCIYDLGRLQDDFRLENGVSAIEVDYFRADELCTYFDEELALLTLEAISTVFDIEPIDKSKLADVAVVRAKNAVSHFSPGSALSCPPTRLQNGLYMAGDWIDRTGHASWSTEKSVVSGTQAAVALSKDFGIRLPEVATEIVPASPDSKTLSALRRIAKNIRG